MDRVSKKQVAICALSVFLLDQLTKWSIIYWLELGARITIINGLFDIVHWNNTGAAWNLFTGKNAILALISLIALGLLIIFYRWFPLDKLSGRLALGMIIGGILGNLTDRIIHGHVIDFIYFYVIPRGSSSELGFPAFNIADSAICISVLLLIKLSWGTNSKPICS